MMGQHSAKGTPLLTLRQAIDRLSGLFPERSRLAVPIEDAMMHLGYGGSRPDGERLIATLVAYGLVEKKTADCLGITTLGQHILWPATQFDHDAALVDAAGRPALFRAARQHFEDRPLDREELRHWFRRQGLDKASIDDATQVFCKTVAYVREPQHRVAGVVAAVAARQAAGAKPGANATSDCELEATDIAWE
jgi:hypothetical protein